MSLTTYVDAARDRAAAERAAAEAKRAGVATFADRVAELSAEAAPAGAPGVAGTGGLARRREAAGVGGCESVRAAFAETVPTDAVGDGSGATDASGADPLTDAIRRELTESIAVALAPASSVPLSPELKRGILAEARTRRTELDVLHRALGREIESLAAAGETVSTVTGWIAAADETPLSELGFDALRRRHERLDDFRGRCDDAAADRQSELASTTAVAAEAGLRHRDLVESIYDGLAVDHPVLTTLVRLDGACRECQRSVRAHLVRRA